MEIMIFILQAEDFEKQTTEENNFTFQTNRVSYLLSMVNDMVTDVRPIGN
jgi:hypothetical protein